MRFIKTLFATALIIACVGEAKAYIRPDIDQRAIEKQRKDLQNSIRGGRCLPSGSFEELNINNVRCRLLGGGDMWWDLNEAKYEVPKVDPGSSIESVSSIFAGSVWIGGYDPAGSLKIAAIDYRSGTSNEWWPGPLKEDGTTCKEDCGNWDDHFQVLGDEIRTHIANYSRAIKDPAFSYTADDIPDNIKFWPARGNRFFAQRYGFELPNTVQGLGLFFETEGNENDIYEPELGEYPQIDVRGCQPGIFADQMFFWVYNDNGDVHTNTQGDAIQMEVQVQGFAYQTTDEINDMTFYRYKLINRAAQVLDSCFFSMWIDPDLGCDADDYIGCDSTKSLMYVYNSDEEDGNSGINCTTSGQATYQDEVPILGVDYFRGPLIPVVYEIFGKDTTCRPAKQGEDFDELKEGGMSSFTYYNRQGTGPTSATEDPSNAIEFYRYMSGSWRDGTRFTRGGDGYNVGASGTTNYAVHDPPDQTGGWSMCEEGLPNGDRRTLQTTGPMRLDPGAINELIIGVVWVPDQIYPCPNLQPLFAADQKAQDLFDNCFELPRGPDAPNVDLIELDRELILVLTNEPMPASNNENEEYMEAVLGIPEGETDSNYVFEGYRIWQVIDASVTAQELNDVEKSREIFTVDVKNGVTKIYEWQQQANPVVGDPDVYVPVLQVEGPDDGIRHTFRVTEDRFTRTSDKRLVNHREYYFYVTAYGYNNYKRFDITAPIGTQAEPYIAGRLNIGDRDRDRLSYIGVPRPMVYQDLNSAYGDGTIITRLDGVGTGSNFLDISQETEDAIMDGTFDGTIKYRAGGGPVDVKIYNPLEVKSGDYVLQFFDDDLSNDELEDPIRWILIANGTDTVFGNKTLSAFDEQVIYEYGISLTLGQTADVGAKLDDSNGFVGDAIEYADAEKPFWLSTVRDGDQVQVLTPVGPFNYTFDYMKYGDEGLNDDVDPERAFEGQLFAPYLLVDYQDVQMQIGPAWDHSSNRITVETFKQKKIDDLNNVDVVFTSDTSKWSRCIVVESANDAANQAGFFAEGDVDDFDLRAGESVGKYDRDGDGLPDPDGDGTGMGWFPGYAIDVETGERLNVFFAENSAYNQDLIDFYNVDLELIGTDMMWNPDSRGIIQEVIDAGIQNSYAAYIGAQHFIYVTRTKYDSCAALRAAIERSNVNKARELATVTWVGVPILNDGTTLNSLNEGLIPNDVKIKLRVDKSYDYAVGTNDNNGYNHYEFSFEGVEPTDITSNDGVAEALKEVNVVPNPYYGFSDYEVGQFDNFVKITNLPDRCIVTIYSLDGRFIRQYQRDEVGVSTIARENRGIETGQTDPDVIWDLNNYRGIPIASGTYLIHVKDSDTGEERTLKWFGVHRKFDPSGL